MKTAKFITTADARKLGMKEKKKIKSTLGREDLRMKERLDVIAGLSAVAVQDQLRVLDNRPAFTQTNGEALELKVKAAYKLWRKASVLLRVEPGVEDAVRFNARLADFEEMLETPNEPAVHAMIVATGLYTVKANGMAFILNYLIGRVAADVPDLIIPELFRTVQLYVRQHTPK